MRRDSKAFRERFLRWKAGEAVYDNGKPIEHYAYGEEGDKIYAPNGKYAITGQLYEDWRQQNLASRAAIEAAAKQPVLRPETRSRSELQRLHTQAAADRQRIREERLKQKNEEAFWNLVSLTSPSIYVGQVVGLPITGAAALATDALAFGAAGALKSGVKSVINTVGRVGNTVENIINNKGFALASPSGKIVTWVGKGLGSKISLEDAGNGWLRPSYIQSKTPGTGRKLYDAAINTAKRNGYKGIESGFDLLSAPKTYRTWEHYPSRIYLGNYGKHSNQNVIRAPYIGNNVNTPEALLNATKNNIEVIFNNAPVYGLTTPSEEVTTFNLPKFLLKKNYEEIPIGLRSSEPLIARGTPDITAENAAYSLPGAKDEFKKYLYDIITHRSAKELIEEGDPILPWTSGQVVDMNTPDELKQMYYNSVLPRMRNMRVGWHGGLIRPTVKSNVDAALERGYSVYDKDIWDKSSASKYAGFYDPRTNHIAVELGHEDFALGHEYRHRLDKLLPKSSMESDIIEGAYDNDFLMLSERYPELNGVRMADEAVTTNFDARLLAIGKYHALNTDWKLLNKIIDKLSDDEIIEAVYNSNGYGHRYILWLENNGKLDTSAARKAFADKHRDAMKFVGAFGIPATLALPQLNK